MKSTNPFHYDVHYEKTAAVWQLSEYFLEHIPFNYEQLIFCCIGTDRSTGDTLGPLVGHFLTQNFTFPFAVFGTLEKPVHALNLTETQQIIAAKSPTPFIIAIDACLGDQASIGSIIFKNGSLFPGKAVQKQLPPIGDVSIKGVVNVGGFMENAVLQNTRLHVTHTMSHTIANALQLAWQRYVLKQKHPGHYQSYNNQRRQQIGYTNFR